MKVIDSFKVVAGGGGGGSNLSRTDLFQEELTPGNSVDVTSSAFTPPNNSLIVLHVSAMTRHSSGQPEFDTANTVVTGGGLTWTKQAGYDSPASGRFQVWEEIWTAPVATGASMTINLSNSATDSNSSSRVHFQAIAYTGYNTSTPVAQVAQNTHNTDGAHTLTLSSAPNVNSVVAAGCLYSSSGPTALSDRQPGAGWTEIYDVTDNGYGSASLQVRGNSTSTSVDWDSVSGIAPDSPFLQGSAMAIEIQSS